MKKMILLGTVIFQLFLLCNKSSAQNIFPATGRAGIFTVSPAASLQVKGGARIGTLSNYVNIDSATGNLSFVGTSAYRVADNQFAFQSATYPNLGLFFNAASLRFEFRSNTGTPIFNVGATTGNGVFNGTLKVGAYTLPATDGTNGQVLKTNGIGVLSWNSDNNNLYTAGAGISINSNTIANTAPDQTVVLNNGTGISVTGVYPNFTIATNGSNANLNLSNLAVPTAVNVDLLPNINGGYDIGSAGLSWKNIYMGGDIYMSGFRTVRSDGNNIYVGLLAGQAELAGLGVSNTGIGNQALKSSISGRYNTASGAFALYSTTTGNSNTANGYNALYTNTTGYSNVAVGTNALYNNTTIGNLVAVGDSALYNNGVGVINSFDATWNTAIGSKALYKNTRGYSNTAVGYYALDSNTTGVQNTGIGVGALQYNSTGNNNTAFSPYALYKNTTGGNNVAIGEQSLSLNTIGNDNTSVGFFSLGFNTTGYSNVALGVKALYSNTTQSNMVAVGDSALYKNTTGNLNTAVGSKALYSNTNGSNNTANGYQALYSNSLGDFNTANGLQALFYNTTGNYNTANGESALYSNTTGSGNTAGGEGALGHNTTGYKNTADGWQALSFNTTGSSNVAIGVYALLANTTASNLVAVGDSALYNNGFGQINSYDGVGNTALGSKTLSSNTVGYNNTASGSVALSNNTSGYNNAAYGVQALLTNTTGLGNTALGVAADVTTGSLQNATAVGYFASATASNQVRIGNFSVTSIGGYTNWTNISDGRVKKNIKQNVPGLAFINKLQPVTYNLDLDAADKITKPAGETDKTTKTILPSGHDITSRKAKEQVLYTGFIAQDVEKAAKSLNYDFSGVDAAKNSKDLYGLRYSDFVVPLVKAVQELSKENDSIKNENTSLKKDFDELKNLVLSIQQKQDACSPCSGQVSTQSQSYSTVLTDAATLQQNVPNPFTHTTTIGYSLPQKFTTAQIIITDNTGKTIKAVNVSGNSKGNLNVDAATLSSGAYNYSLIVDGKLIGTKQMILAK